ncbi:MAG: hypothetical protein WCR31_08280 [Treponema sp.]
MLYTIDGSLITFIPHHDDYEIWISRLSKSEIHEINKEITKLTDNKDVNVSAWIPGNKWEGTPFQAIYEKACKRDYGASGKCFGLFVWVSLMNDSRDWYFIKQKKTSEDNLDSMIYFKKT